MASPAHVDDLVRIGAGIAFTFCFSMLAHWRIRHVLIAAALAGAAASAWLQILLSIVYDDFGFASVLGFFNAGVQYFALSAMIGVFFEMRRRRQRK
jgi:hypothetical protein